MRVPGTLIQGSLPVLGGVVEKKVGDMLKRCGILIEVGDEGGSKYSIRSEMDVARGLLETS